MSGEWKFVEHGVEIAGAGLFKLDGLPTATEIEAAGAGLQEVGAAFASLMKAVIAFETGGAIYRDCLQNVADLQAGLVEGRDELEKIYGGMATFFEPGRSPFKSIEPGRRLQFATELLRDMIRRVTRPVPPRREPPPTVPPAQATAPDPVAPPAAPAAAAAQLEGPAK